MIKREELIKIGDFVKPHGIHGELSFTFIDDIFDRSDSPYIVCEMDGIFVPFFISDYRFRTDNSALMILEGIDSEEKAKSFMKKEIFYPKSFVPDDESHDVADDYYIGYAVFDKNQGEIGRIIDVDTSTPNILFVIKYKRQEILIPASDEYVCEIDDEEKTILMDIPDGLLDL